MVRRGTPWTSMALGPNIGNRRVDVDRQGERPSGSRLKSFIDLNTSPKRVLGEGKLDRLIESFLGLNTVTPPGWGPAGLGPPTARGTSPGTGLLGAASFASPIERAAGRGMFCRDLCGGLRFLQFLKDALDRADDHHSLRDTIGQVQLLQGQPQARPDGNALEVHADHGRLRVDLLLFQGAGSM